MDISNPEYRHNLLRDLRAMSDGSGHTETIISAAADELEAAWRQLSALTPEDGSVAAVKNRADDNGNTCREMMGRMRSIRDAADAALRMDWLIQR